LNSDLRSNLGLIVRKRSETFHGAGTRPLGANNAKKQFPEKKCNTAVGREIRSREVKKYIFEAQAHAKSTFLQKKNLGMNLFEANCNSPFVSGLVTFRTLLAFQFLSNIRS
jgi:hypothetical protein